MVRRDYDDLRFVGANVSLKAALWHKKQACMLSTYELPTCHQFLFDMSTFHPITSD